MRPRVTIFKTNPSRRLFLAGGAALAGALALPAFGPARAADAAPFTTMAADVAHQKALDGEIILVDIRTPEEWAETGIGEGAIAINLRDRDFVQRLVALRQAFPDKPIALICRTGHRSGYAVTTLAGQGFPGLIDVSEGMAGGPNGTGWIPRGLPTYPGTPEEIRKRFEAVLAR